MIIRHLLLILSLLFSLQAIADDGIRHIKSNHSVEETSTRLINILKQKGMTIFNQVKHSESAHNVGVEIPPTELIIFGNPNVGSPLMKCAQTVALDLPQKALIWQNDKDEIYISYNDPDHLKQRHNIKGCEKNLDKISKALKGLLTKAASN